MSIKTDAAYALRQLRASGRLAVPRDRADRACDALERIEAAAPPEFPPTARDRLLYAVGRLAGVNVSRLPDDEANRLHDAHEAVREVVAMIPVPEEHPAG